MIWLKLRLKKLAAGMSLMGDECVWARPPGHSRTRQTMPYKDPEKQREADRRWREANPEKVREAHRRWREANPEKQREATRRWHEANPEKGREQIRRWREANLERARVEDAYPDPHLHTLVSSQLST